MNNKGYSANLFETFPVSKNTNNGQNSYKLYDDSQERRTQNKKNKDVEKFADMQRSTYIFKDNSHGYEFEGINYDVDELKNKRKKFIVKVFMILLVQLLVTTGITLIFILVDPIKKYVQQSYVSLVLAFIFSFAILIVLICCDNIARSTPWNFIFLSLFTITESYLVGIVSTFYDTKFILYAIIITIVVVIGLTIHAYTTKHDFTGFGPYIFGALIVLFCFGILNAIFCSTSKCQVINTIYSGLGAFIFSLCLILDVQLIVGGKHRQHQFSEDEYIFAALHLYLDIVNLFLYILNLFHNSE